ncbi:hypothetical protein DYH09_34735, partial [bacterium CPR1]|nr:hypothetical protein [bacterium CPR1]
MGKSWLVLCDVDSIQSWLLRSVHLREIAGASQLLAEHDRRLPELARNGEVLSCGGGTALVRFTDEESAWSFRGAVTSSLQEETESATMTTSEPVPLEGDFGAAVDRATASVERSKRLGHALGERVDFCHALRCQGCGQEPAVTQASIGGDDRWLGKSCLKRHRARERGSWLDWMRACAGWQDLGLRDLPSNTNELASGTQLAVMLADVDGVGDHLASLRDEPAYRAFSRGLKNAMQDAVVAAIARAAPPGAGAKLGVDVLYAGGDDLLLACRSDLALTLVEKLVTEFSRRAGAGQPWLQGKPLGLSVGCAIVGPKYPFRSAHSLAAGMLRRAKAEARRLKWSEGAVDWAVVTESWGEAEPILADRVVESATCSLHLTGRPYRACSEGTRSLGAFRQACHGLARGFPRNKLFDLRGCCTASRLMRQGAGPTDRQVRQARKELDERIGETVMRLERNPEVARLWADASRWLPIEDG